ncbi:MAG: hypothetical protein A2X40_06940 [Elusimicrobia bacterium GWC2_65_9]|nr:MAG: hypothetical protein A2X37_09090 [Elusimicrobia bacterium GWA2_66_18]OGR71135.1 MAG: hypothetical protein A2X40_06940 [Elusimicrobia bacterium GWC2_65_9]
MKKTRWRLFLLAAALLPSSVLAATVTVLVQETTLRKRAQFFALASGTAKLGQTFEASGPSGGWYKTDSGYIHQSAVATKKIRLGSGESVGGTATAEEVTLAGKGFNAQVEKSYGAKNASANFSAVNAMERRAVSDSALRDFLRAGGLIPAGDSQ